MIKSLHQLLRQANGKKMVISLTAENESEAILTITTEFEKLDSENPVQKRLSLPIAVKGYPASIEAELATAINTLETDTQQSTENASTKSPDAAKPTKDPQVNNEIDCL